MPRTRWRNKGDDASTPELQLNPAQSNALDVLAEQAVHTLLYGGSRSGKTFFLTACLLLRALRYKSRHLILRYRFNACKRTIWYDTLPAVRRICFPEVGFKENRSDWLLTCPNGSEVWIGGLDDKERTEKVLGTEYATIYYNECSEMNYSAVTMAHTRLAQKTPLFNRALYDCNPPSTSHWSHSLFIKHQDPLTGSPVPNPSDYLHTKLNPEDNADNIAEGYIEGILANLPERQRRRFLKGEWLDDVEGALWTRAMVEGARRVNFDKPPTCKRVVVAVDPAVTATAASAETGIMVQGEKLDGTFVLLEDCSLKGTPTQWAEEVIDAYERWHADRVIGEVNNGGDLVEQNLRTVNKHVPYTAVRATRGKLVRAEPVASLMEQHKVEHWGVYNELEDQLCNYTGEEGEKSPDRMDAYVWGFTYLSSKGRKRVGTWGGSKDDKQKAERQGHANALHGRRRLARLGGRI